MLKEIKMKLKEIQTKPVLCQELKRLIKKFKDKFRNVTLKKFLKEAPSKLWRSVNPSSGSRKLEEGT